MFPPAKTGESTEIPPEGVLAELFLQVRLPVHLPLVRERGDRAALVIDDEIFPIGDRRGIRSAPVLVFAGTFRSERLAPDLGPVPVKGDDAILPVDPAGDEDPVLPHRGRAAADPGELHFPEHVLGGENSSDTRPARQARAVSPAIAASLAAERVEKVKSIRRIRGEGRGRFFMWRLSGT